MTIMTRSGAKFWWKEELPREVAYLWKQHSFEPWSKKLYSEILAEKAEKQQRLLERKTWSETLKPAFIRVFYNDTTFFGGWWIYITTLKKEWAINFRHDTNWCLVVRAMEIYPCGVLPMQDNFIIWAKEFSLAYKHKGFNRNKNQGLARCLCRLSESGQLMDILPINQNNYNNEKRKMELLSGYRIHSYPGKNQRR